MTRRRWIEHVAISFGTFLVGMGRDERRTLHVGHGILAAARRMLGTPYVWGAPNFPTNTDCSRLTQSAYGEAGFALPRTVIEQCRSCTVPNEGPGALIFFATDERRPGVVTHVGVSVGNGLSMVSANRHAGAVVEENWARSRYWVRRFVAYGALPSRTCSLKGFRPAASLRLRDGDTCL
jgi:cell wall-associated NlpC family hydrolase